MFASEAEMPSQTVRGKVVNSSNKLPIRSATVQIPHLEFGAFSNELGDFRIANVPIGRYILQVSLVGFETYSVPIVVTSGREVVLNIELNESFVRTGEVVVTANRATTAINEAAIVSSIEFTVDDASRYAGSRADPARMAQNLAGVLGANDSRNDIIIRGGSPIELLWRLDGMDIPNPNHFATQGATGGPISAINVNILDNSDFLTGAFPAEYGDKLSGVFDLRTRRGNDNRFEYVGQFGFNGFELGAEGPVKFANGSFIANYRYSFLGLLEAMGVDFGFAGIPYYQDASFKADFDLNDYNRISITGLWGISSINIEQSKTDDAATGDFDLLNATDLYAVVFNWRTIFNEKLYGNLMLGTTLSVFRTEIDSLTIDRASNSIDKYLWMDVNSREAFSDIKYSLHYSPSNLHSLSMGATSRFRNYSISEERFTSNYDSDVLYNLFRDGDSYQILSYVNWNWRILPNLTSNIGIHSQFLELSKKSTFEPRFGLNWRFLPNNSLNFGFGVHRQSQPLITYFEHNENRQLDFTSAVHYIIGYQYNISNQAFIKIESYYKDLSKAPIEIESSSFSLLNSGANFGRVFSGGALVSNGLGKSYGAELTLMKHFADSYYFTGTASFVRQKYKGSDGVWRFGAFDNRFIINLLAGSEWRVGNDFIIEFSGRYTIAGGAPYTPIDEEKSRQRNNTYFDNTRAFSFRYPNYSRFDIKIDFRHNLRNMAIISFVSIENVLNQQNILNYMWSSGEDKVKQINQLGMFPIGGLRVEF